MREKKFQETQSIAATIKRLATPGMKPKALIDAVREVHPKASKKDVARAAFLSVIMSAEFEPEDAQALHDLAIDTRDEADGEDSSDD
jgi:hypothetical protein